LHSPNPWILYPSTNRLRKNEDAEVIRIKNKIPIQKGKIRHRRRLSDGLPFTLTDAQRDRGPVYKGLFQNLRPQDCRIQTVLHIRKKAVRIEDQGWVAWFTIASILKRPITVYGDGRQVRDVLFVDDLANCYKMAHKTPLYSIG